jgi:hypothetical protein
MLSNVLIFTKAQVLKRHYKEILHTDNECKFDEKCRKYGQYFIYAQSKVKVSSVFTKLSSIMQIYMAFCPDWTWNTGSYRQKFTYPHKSQV